jgi:HlyD family secretion protein
MQRSKDRRPSSWAVLLFTILLATGTIGGLALGWTRLHARKTPGERYSVTGVRRADLRPVLKAGGRVESGKRTIIECQLENFSVGVRGQRLGAGGASVLLKLIPEGTVVQRGDVLAVLDSADYVELVRLQRITVERAQADHLQAELDHEIAKLAVVEYRDGTMKETTEDYQRRIAVARSDLERAQDRLNWSRGMKTKGYVSVSTVRSDEFAVTQLELKLKNEEGAFDLFRKFTVPKTMRELEGDVLSAKADLDYQVLRVQRHVDRLATLERQVELCTIRAPHDGYVIHANDTRRQIFIEEGMPVRQNQKLFYLPDLRDMEVVALLNESIVDQVRAGMRAHVQVEGLPNQFMNGRITKVAQLAVPDWRSDVRYFEGIVKLDSPLPGLKPGMTAQVEVEMPERDNVLAVPSEAVTIDDGEDVCFVVRGEDVERRQVKIGHVTEALAEVTHGLKEGEQVVLNPHPEDIEAQEAPQPDPVVASGAGAGAEGSPSDVAASR